ncbi:MAG: hypothetical protein D3918_00695 [Candidatus Electrothrix sp. AX2]|nr:hypothetical protein [Candidatus Electrothrix gigas]
MLTAKRKYAILSVPLVICLTSSAQRIVIYGLDFSFIRIMICVAFLRIYIKKETSDFHWKGIDNVLIGWIVCSVIPYVMLRGTLGAFVFKLGTSFEILGIYFVYRCLIKDMNDVKQLAVALAYLSIPVAICLFYEKQTGRNLFSHLGGVPEFTLIRQGKLRAQGPFAHPIIAGVFWVTQLPLFISLWWHDAKKWLGGVSVLATFIVVYSCSSSTPIAGLGAVVVGIACYPLRHNMKSIRLGLLATLTTLHIVMKAPVWHLISRIDFVGGSTGYHRYMLIDSAIRRFSEWWLFGVRSTNHWGWFLLDTANMYVDQAVNGGMAGLIFFIILIIFAFKGMGELLSTLKDSNSNYILAWLLGVALFTHCSVFIAVSYFGQATVVWYLLLAIIGSLTPVGHIARESNENVEPFVVKA